VQEITPDQAAAELATGTAVFFDIRDPQSYATGHVPGAVSVSDANVEELVVSSDKTQRLVVYCYHGNSSLGGVAFFQSRGFSDVASMSGGFELWRQLFPDEIAT
ncbi:MAG: thiosulfate sulfurtransferase, partial [Hyphomicrobiaceae bacterium]